MSIDRRNLLYLTAAAAVAPSATWAQAYPTHPLLLIVPLAPGGGLDFVARAVSDNVANGLGQRIVIENRSGAGGEIGIDAAARSSPDGYTVLITNDNIASVPHLLPMTIDYLTAFAPVIEVARQPQVLSAHASLGVSSLADLIRLAKQRPGLTYASSGAGSNQNILGEWFKKVAGIELQHIPYRGAGQALDDVVAGRVPIGILGPTSLVPYYKSGTLRLLAQSSATRSSLLPDIPTFEEGGVAGVALDAWHGVFVPTGTSPAVVDRLNAAFNKALADPAIRSKLLGAILEPIGGTPEQLSQLFREDYAKYGRLVKELNIKLS